MKKSFIFAALAFSLLMNVPKVSGDVLPTSALNASNVPDRFWNELNTKFFRHVGQPSPHTRYGVTLLPARRVRVLFTKADFATVQPYFATGTLAFANGRNIPFRMWFALGPNSSQGNPASLMDRPRPFDRVQAKRYAYRGPMNGVDVDVVYDVPENAFPEPPRTKIISPRKAVIDKKSALETIAQRSFQSGCEWDAGQSTIGNALSPEVALFRGNRPLTKTEKLPVEFGPRSEQFQVVVSYVPMDELTGWYAEDGLVVTRLTNCGDFLRRYVDLNQVVAQ